MKSKVFASGLAIVLGFLSPIGLIAGGSEVAIAQTSAEREKELEADRLFEQGSRHYRINQIELAIRSWKKSLAIYRKISNRQGESRVLNSLGLAHYSLEEYVISINYYKMSLAIVRSIGNRSGEGDLLKNLGNAYFHLENYSQAMILLEESLIIAQQQRNHLLEAKILRSIGRTHLKMGQNEEAAKSFQKQIELYQYLNNFQEENAAFISLGWVYNYQGRYHQSIPIFQQALKKSRDLGDRDQEIQCLYALGWTYDDLGQRQKSILSYEEGLKIARETNNKVRILDLLNGLGWVHNALRDYKIAIQFFEEQESIAKEIKDIHQESNALNGLGWSFREQKQYKKAINFSKQALSLHQQIGDRREEAYALADLGKSFTALGDYEQAIYLYQRALSIQNEMGNRWGEGITLNDVAELMIELKQTELAIVFYKQSVGVREAIRKDIQALPRDQQESFTQTVAGTYRKLADLLIQQRRLAEAQAVLELLKLQELRNYTRDTSAAIKGSGISLAKIEQVALTEILKTFNTIGNFTQQLQDCEKTNCPTLGKLVAQRDNLNTAIQKELKTQRKLLAAHYATESATLTPKELNNEARRIVQNPGTVLIYPLILQDKIQFLLAFKANDGSVIFRPFETPIAATQLTNTIIEFRKQLENPGDLKTLQATSQTLYNALIKPLEPELKAANIKHLVFAPDSTIRYIPLAALHDGQQYLIQRYSITPTPPASQTNTTEPSPRPIPGQKQLLAMGADHFPNTKYSNLLNVPIEIDSIAATDKPGDRGIYPGTEVLNQAFSFDTIRETLKGQTYSILHLATHGAFIAGNVEESYIVPGSGPNLTGDRIDALANSNGFKNLHLVVLSACQTGVGDRASDGMEIPGISHFFLKNNVKSVLASLWNVNDASTSLFMQQFYQNLAQGMTKAQALQKIQTEFLNSKLTTNNIPRAGGRRSIPGQLPPNSLAHPYYWAPFILIGNSL